MPHRHLKSQTWPGEPASHDREDLLRAIRPIGSRLVLRTGDQVTTAPPPSRAMFGSDCACGRPRSYGSYEAGSSPPDASVPAPCNAPRGIVAH